MDCSRHWHANQRSCFQWRIGPKGSIGFVSAGFQCWVSVVRSLVQRVLVAAVGIYLSVGIVSYSRPFKSMPMRLTSDLNFVVIPMSVLMGRYAGRAGYHSRPLYRRTIPG